MPIFPLVLWATTAAAAAAAQPTVIAVVPPVTDQPDEEWLGYSLADELEARLLDYSVFNHASAKNDYPLSVFGWRQSLSAARQANVSVATVLTQKEGRRLGKALGAGAIFTGTYAVKSTSVRVIWTLVGDTNTPKHEEEIPFDGFERGVDRILATLLLDLRLEELGVPVVSDSSLPAAAIRSYGLALTILRDQSLNPRALPSLPGERVSEAYRLLTDATERAPEWQRAWVMRAIASAIQGDPRRARRELDEAKRHGLETTPVMALGAFYLDYQGNTRRAIVTLGTSLNTHLGFLLGLGYLGEAYLHSGMPYEASRIFEIYRRRVPGNPWVSMMHAESLIAMGNADEALVELNALLKSSPESLPVIEALTALHLHEGRLEEARKMAERGLKLAPERSSLLARLASIAIESGKLEEALGMAQRATRGIETSRGEPGSGYPFLVLGRCYGLLGRKEEAIKAFGFAGRLGVEPRDVRTIVNDPRLADIVADQRVPFSSKGDL